jgi:hypothetical protein
MPEKGKPSLKNRLRYKLMLSTAGLNKKNSNLFPPNGLSIVERYFTKLNPSVIMLVAWYLISTQ